MRAVSEPASRAPVPAANPAALAQMPEAPSPARARLQRFGERLSQQPHLAAVRDGVVGSLPIILVGSAFVLLFAPPWPGLSRFLPAKDALAAGTRACAGMVSLYVCAATALSLARRREVDIPASMTTALAVFLIAQKPQLLVGGGFALPLAGLGAGGLFPAFAAAILATETLGFFARRKWGIRLGGGAPEVIVRSFAALLPTTLLLILIWSLVHVFGLDLAGGLGNLFRPLVRGSDALPALMLVVLIDSSLYLVGVHPFSVLSAAKPLWLAALTENMTAAMAGQPIPHLATQEFFIWFTWQGGSGTTLALALLLLRARSQQLKLVGRAGFVPALFNVNEPLLFGVPVVMNGKLAVPFIAAPLVLVTISWAAMRAGLVTPPFAEQVWTLPAPLGAYLATGGDVRAIGLQLVNLCVALAIWWPFVRRYDRELLARELAAPRT